MKKIGVFAIVLALAAFSVSALADDVQYDKLSLNELMRLANQGVATAQRNVGDRYFDGQGVPQDYREAVTWFRKAAEQGDADAQNNLGLMYGNGQGAPRDRVLAYMLLNLAAAGGSDDALANRNAIVKTMSDAQIEEGQALSRAWKVGASLPTASKTGA